MAVELLVAVALRVAAGLAVEAGEALGAADALTEGEGEGDGAEEAVARGESKGEMVLSPEGEAVAEALAVMVGEGGGPHTPAALTTLPALQAAGIGINWLQLEAFPEPQREKACAGSSVGRAEGLISATHWLPVQRAGKICCEGDAEGVEVELLVAVALRVAAGLAVGAGVRLGEADELIERAGEGEDADDAVARAEGKGVGEVSAEGEAVAEALAVVVGEGGGPHTPAAFTTLPALQAAGIGRNWLQFEAFPAPQRENA